LVSAVAVCHGLAAVPNPSSVAEHTPTAHVAPFKQALKHDPQSVSEVCKSAQWATGPPSTTPASGMQSVCPIVHVETHAPSLHVSICGKQMVVHVPQ
jgi:hypothetical protein